jgi:hypothetical protein
MQSRAERHSCLNSKKYGNRSLSESQLQQTVQFYPPTANETK